MNTRSPFTLVATTALIMAGLFTLLSVLSGSTLAVVQAGPLIEPPILPNVGSADEFANTGVYLVPPSQAGSGMPGDTFTPTPLPNIAPVLDAIGDKAIDELATLMFTATATDANGDVLTFTLDAGSVGSIDGSTGHFTWTPTEAQGPGEYTTIVRVSDGQLDDAETITITVNEVNNAPVAVDDSGPGFMTDEDTAFTTANVLTNDTDPDDNPLSVQSFDTSGTLGLVSFDGVEAGSLDTDGFGVPHGYVTTNLGFGDYGNDVAIQSDGKIVVVGDI